MVLHQEQSLNTPIMFVKSDIKTDTEETACSRSSCDRDVCSGITSDSTKFWAECKKNIFETSLANSRQNECLALVIAKTSLACLGMRHQSNDDEFFHQSRLRRRNPDEFQRLACRFRLESRRQNLHINSRSWIPKIKWHKP